MTSHTGSMWRILEILKKVSWVEFCLGRRQLAFACSLKSGQWPLWQVPHVLGWSRWKSQNRKNVYLSPYVEELLNSKVIKSFVPELRSVFCKCFLCFKIPMFHVYMLWTFYVHFTYPYHGYGTKLHTQNVGTSTAVILPTTTGNFHYLKSFGHMIYTLQINTCQNIAKLLTHPCAMTFYSSSDNYLETSLILGIIFRNIQC